MGKVGEKTCWDVLITIEKSEQIVASWDKKISFQVWVNFSTNTEEISTQPRLSQTSSPFDTFTRWTNISRLLVEPSNLSYFNSITMQSRRVSLSEKKVVWWFFRMKSSSLSSFFFSSQSNFVCCMNKLIFPVSRLLSTPHFYHVKLLISMSS